MEVKRGNWVSFWPPCHTLAAATSLTVTYGVLLQFEIDLLFLSIHQISVAYIKA